MESENRISIVKCGILYYCFTFPVKRSLFNWTANLVSQNRNWKHCLFYLLFGCDISLFRYRTGTESFLNDIALILLEVPVSISYEPIRLCTERVPYTYKRNILGTCGIGSTNKHVLETPDVLQETVFYESMYISESSPFSFQWCRSDLICVDSVTKGAMIV